MSGIIGLQIEGLWRNEDKQITLHIGEHDIQADQSLPYYQII